ncbi:MULTISPECIES: TAXI family TRAP transporter solute-binding subunit [Rhodomicrobium]|uniref:TAXI family TRAP transporter solute-binding subunit n=1 Tax=Rhodomicrobium TaxID=1068 RepID=UPI000B4A83FC|nr:MULTISPECIES: TAXI family TRAP transporter solute-binding subunit [Rhodomicrobium]
MRVTSWTSAIISAGALLLSCSAYAQTAAENFQLAQAAGGAVPQRDQFVEELNANTVTIVSGNPNGTYLFMAYDMSAVLDDGNKLRVLPVLGKGGGQNTKDILYLRGVDMGITQSNILRYYNKTGEVGKNIANRLRYVTRLYNEELHLLVAPNINSVEDLRGKKVNFSDIGSGTQTSSQLIFEALRIPIQEVNMGQADAFEAIKKGEIAATILIAGKPTGAFAKIKPSSPDYKLLPFPYPAALQDDYLPATLTHEDYPNMIPEGQTVETIAVGAVLAVFNWAPNTDRYKRVAKFTEALFKNFDKFLEKPRHPKWKEVNLAADLPGWQRFGAAQELLDSSKVQTASQTQLKQDFDRFLTNATPNESAATMSDDRRDALFRKFLEWQGTQR